MCQGVYANRSISAGLVMSERLNSAWLVSTQVRPIARAHVQAWSGGNNFAL